MPMYPSPKASGETRHLVATKSFLIGAVQSYGAKAVLVGWEGSDEDAIKAIQDDAREVIALGCDNADDNGYCLGHRKGGA